MFFPYLLTQEMNVDRKKKLSIINIVITATATATTTVFLLVADYTVKFSFHWDY